MPLSFSFLCLFKIPSCDMTDISRDELHGILLQ